MNLNKGCIEIVLCYLKELSLALMNLNKGCIEIMECIFLMLYAYSMNLNKGCIEINVVPLPATGSITDEP